MPAPRWLARFNRKVTNRLALAVIGQLRMFGVVEHIGRRTGRRYRTPVLAFSRGSTYVVALTYGIGTDWVQNVLAHNGCVLETNRQRLQLQHPRLVHADVDRPVPKPIALVLRIARISDFLILRQETSS